MVNDAPLGRAAGRIDAARADAATTFVDGAGISFGLASAKSGMWEAVRTVSVTNRATVARTYQVASTNGFPGATFTATPATLQLAPGESKSVDLRLVVDAAAAPFPAQPLLDGDVEFRGDAPFVLPWFFVRGARTTVAYDQPALAVVALSGNDVKTPYVYDVGKAEIFTPPDSQWDFLLLAYDPGVSPAAMRMAWAENRVASGDSVVALHSGDTTAEVDFDARDKFGTPFTELPTQINRLRVLRLLYAKRPGLMVTVNLPDGVPDLFMSPVSSAFTFYFFEGYFDVKNGRAYNVQHEPLAGVAGSQTLSAGPASYKRVSIRFPPPTIGPNATFACLTTGVQTAAGRLGGLGGCSGVELGPPMVVEYFTTAESAQGVSGIDFDTGITAVGMLRGIDGRILSCSWTNPSAAAYRISDGEEIALGTSALHAFSFFGTAPNRYIGLPPGFTGPLGEWYRYTTADTPWVSYDAAGAQVAAGTYTNLTTCDEGPCDPGPAPQPGGRYVATRDGMDVAGHSSRGEVEVRFGGDRADLEAPTLTALRVMNAQGRLAERLDRNGNASLFFAAGDYHYPPAQQRAMGTTRELKREATRVSFRAHGTASWIPLTPVHLGSDLGVVLDLRRFPVGEMYRADLSAVTRAGADAVDLRFEIEDVAGNRTTWTQSPAIIVAGDGAPPPPRKRRSSRP
jgi:hypothetical protein